VNSYDVAFKLVDSPTDESQLGGTIAADGLIEAFQKFPFAEQVKRAEAMKDVATFPTITFKRHLHMTTSTLKFTAQLAPVSGG
jgi:hypothetical protein